MPRQSELRRVATLLIASLVFVCFTAECRGEGSASRKDVEESFFSLDYFKLLAADTAHVLTSPGRWKKKEWLTFALAAGVVGGAAFLDKPVWETMKRNRSAGADRAAHVLEEFGGFTSLAATIPFYIAGEVNDDAKAKAVALDGLAASMISAGIISPALKFIAGRRAPRDDEGTFSFRPFTYGFQISGGAQSFPSGHAAQAFALGSVIAAHYDETWIKAAAYGIASLAGLSRVYQGVHFMSDFTAGALIGTAVGHAVVRFNDKRRAQKKERSIFVVPFLAPGTVGVTLIINIDDAL